MKDREGKGWANECKGAMRTPTFQHLSTQFDSPAFERMSTRSHRATKAASDSPRP